MKNMPQAGLTHSFKEGEWGRVVALSLFFASLLLLHACDRTESAEDFPPPGKMRVIAVEPIISQPSDENLVINGNFSIWHAGSPVPEGFFAPENRDVTYIVKRESRGGTGPYSVDQYWNKSDVNEPLLELFHGLTRPVRPDQVYKLTIYARSYDNTTASITVAALDPGGIALAQWPEAIILEPGQGARRIYSVKIKTNHNGTLAIIPHCNERTTFRGRVMWLEWQLVESALLEGEEALLPQAYRE